MPRIVRTKGRRSRRIYLRRFQCKFCKRIYRQIPAFILPYKQYEAEVVKGVLEGLITPQTMGYEDYPCEMTMVRWKNSSKYHRDCFYFSEKSS
ncbi:MAG: DUF6431 domain-containing protein [Eubacteriales bacterium]|nr:DUF6431 domain-containing protein [Eubacteriales bacterium]